MLRPNRTLTDWLLNLPIIKLCIRFPLQTRSRAVKCLENRRPPGEMKFLFYFLMTGVKCNQITTFRALYTRKEIIAWPAACRLSGHKSPVRDRV